MFARKAFFTAILTVSALALTGCMSAGDEQTPTAPPTNQPAVTAEASAIPGNVQTDAYNWQTGAQDVENAITRLSEVSEARVLVAGNTALVGVKFDPAYQGEMTDRIREMIAGVVRQADGNIQEVAVTSEEEDVQKIYDISEKTRAGQAFDDFKDDINGIVRNATTLR